MTCVCGHEMTRTEWKNQFVCHRCGRTKPIIENYTNAEFMIKLLVEENAEAFLDFMGELLGDGIPTADWFKWWLEQPVENENI